MAVVIDIGQAAIGKFTEAAHNGTVSYDADVARECAGHYDQLIATLREQLQAVRSLTEVSGFGGFVSAQELRHGFRWKAGEAERVLNEYISGAYRMKAAFLVAGKLYAEADSANADAVAASGEHAHQGAAS